MNVMGGSEREISTGGEEKTEYYHKISLMGAPEKRSFWDGQIKSKQFSLERGFFHSFRV
jgi:hypothetical protein